MMEKHKPGYEGKDEMRSKAERLLGRFAHGGSIHWPMAGSHPIQQVKQAKKHGGRCKKMAEGGFFGQPMPTSSVPTRNSVMGNTPVYKKGGHRKKKLAGGGFLGGLKTFANDMTPPIVNRAANAVGNTANAFGNAVSRGVNSIASPYMKKGGRCRKKMAMGGVGKIRHGQSTASGAPRR